MTVTIHVGDALEVLRALPSESVQCVVTSPPYFGLRDYGVDGQMGLEPTPAAFIEHLVAVFEEVKRVLRPDGLCFVNIGDSYSGSGKGPTGSNGIQNAEQRQGFASGYLRANGEMSKGGRKSKTEGTAGTPAKNLLLIPERFAIAMQDSGWVVRSRIAWCKKAPMPESTKDRPTSAWEHIFMFSKSQRYFYDAEAVRQPLAAKSLTHRGGGTNGKAGNQDDLGKVASGNWARDVPVRIPNEGGASLRNFWLLGPEPSREQHYAAFPSEIPKRCILAGTSQAGACPACGAPWVRSTETEFVKLATRRPTRKAVQPGADMADINSRNEMGFNRVTTLGWAPSCACVDAGPPVPQTVLDPFLGSGTTALVADRLGRDAIGIELSPEYAEMARRRIEGDERLFSEPVVVEQAEQLSLLEAL